MKIGSLFSGAGGLDIAVEQFFGARTVWHCELNPAASKVLAHRWPGVPNLGDITAVDWAEVEPVDILAGGFPCQDVSAAGRRAGIAEGTRSGLWALFAEVINQLRPRAVVIENVRGLLSARAYRAMESEETTVGDGADGPILRALGAVLGDLADLGYDAQWTTVAASAVGAPHKRERVFIVAHPAGKPWLVNDGDQLRAGWGAQRPGPATGTGSGADPARDGRHEGRPVADPEGQRGTHIERRGATQGQPVVAEPGAGDRDCVGPDSEGIRGIRGPAGELAPVDLQPGLCQHCAAALRRAEAGEPALWNDDCCPDPNNCDTTVVDLLPTPVARDFKGTGPADMNRNSPCMSAIADLLPTPSAANGAGGQTSRSGDRGDELLLGGIAKAYGSGDLLPTPNAQDGNGGGRYNSDGHQNTLPGTVLDLLPTPKSSDGQRQDCEAERRRNTPSLVAVDHYLPTPSASDATGGGQHPDQREGHTRQLCDYALLDGTSRWGKYAAAIARWEAVAGPAPSPTEPNRNGNPRLAAAFPEWMMGWPAGWVTAVPGISRNDALRIIGNGVCPQQAYAALQILVRVSACEVAE
ncbi:DNA methylase [Mycobacterium phage Quico]|uniref:DNA (cytosine-5-)-methyltransferase n=1 Tax=Mycobacterium phage Florinda TaxID=1675549 RepID=A0A0K1LSD6_9CAUD|nr:DNA methyltransferase [Mycobacterium phage Quico]YP_009206798.1 DNA methyltransferase [Mycobacterium phage Florinda]AKU45050.1 DNA methylase [Mycobacterium phage Florinda]AKU45164.1 DNA methylase [Mycobacterium phage Girafales]AKU45660.1 DNA methylase [Mycobacterium phage Quico]